MESMEFNWLSKHMKKVRSSQTVILALNWEKHSCSLCLSLNNLSTSFTPKIAVSVSGFSKKGYCRK